MREVSLTDRQRDVLNYVRRHYRTAGVPPTVEEITQEFGFRSRNGAANHLKVLARKGLMVAPSGARARGWMPTVPTGHCPCCGELRRK